MELGMNSYSDDRVCRTLVSQSRIEASLPSKPNNEHWQTLVALHRALLHGPHDFLLASQPPSASPALHQLAAKCLGRYKMAIENDDIRDREVWTRVAQYWYSRAFDNARTARQLYHYLAILARPNALQQLFYSTKPLCVAIPLKSAREWTLTLFEPVLNADSRQGHQYRLPPLDTTFVKAHGLLFTNRDMQKFDPTVTEFLDLLDNQIGRVTRKFMEPGYHIAVSNCVAMLGFGDKDAILMKAFTETTEDARSLMVGFSALSTAYDATAALGLSSDDDGTFTEMGPDSIDEPYSIYCYRAPLDVFNSTLKIALSRIGDPNVLPFTHALLTFLHEMLKNIGHDYPWEGLAKLLNASRASMTAERKERIPWLGYQLAPCSSLLAYQSDKYQESVSQTNPATMERPPPLDHFADNDEYIASTLPDVKSPSDEPHKKGSLLTRLLGALNIAKANKTFCCVSQGCLWVSP